MSRLSNEQRDAVIASRRGKRLLIVRLLLLLCAIGFLLKALAGEKVFDAVMTAFFVIIAVVLREAGGEIAESVIFPRRRKKR